MKIIEQRQVKRDHGFDGWEVIIDHPKHGRLYVIDGFGGGDIEGGCIRWKHGSVFSLKKDDTFESLESERWNDSMDRLDAVLEHLDTDRPWLDWDGFVIEKMMAKLGF